MNGREQLPQWQADRLAVLLDALDDISMSEAGLWKSWVESR